MKKTCPKCKIEYPATKDYFYADLRRKNGLRCLCIKCGKEYDQKRYLEHKDKIRAYTLEHKADRQAYNLKIAYGLSIEDYNKMFEQQNGCCAICGRPQKEFKCKLGVDHNHETGQVKGLLCWNCNSLLGLCHDNPIILTKALNYLTSVL